MNEIGAVCVYAGSSGGDGPTARLAQELGALIAANGLTLVYGGGSVGLMGIVADAALDAGGTVIGVIPSGVFTREVAHGGLTQLIEVTSMHERKQCMYELADAFVALPGGLGTLEELAETATWGQLGIHRKPIATLDVDGFWSPLHDLFARAAADGYLKAANLELVLRVRRLEDLLPALRAYDGPHVEKWIELGDT
ncbi:MAG TPA: TIGR00730 family Rossman fold protein [Acidimicrobiia bacterium]|nr:TIGR00730 family Rossman fold protein [Acidimicrobiia bacterium]